MACADDSSTARARSPTERAGSAPISETGGTSAQRAAPHSGLGAHTSAPCAPGGEDDASRSSDA